MNALRDLKQVLLIGQHDDTGLIKWERGMQRCELRTAGYTFRIPIPALRFRLDLYLQHYLFHTRSASRHTAGFVRVRGGEDREVASAEQERAL